MHAVASRIAETVSCSLTEVENRHSPQAVDFGISKSPLSEESEPDGSQIKLAIKTLQKATDKITSESATTEVNMEESTSQVTPHVLIKCSND